MTEGTIHKIHKYQKYFTATVAAVIAVTCYVLWFSVNDPGQRSHLVAQTCTPSAILVNPCRPLIGGMVGGYAQVGSDTTSQNTFYNKRLNDPNVLNNPSAAVTITNHMDVDHAYQTQGTNLFSGSASQSLNFSGTSYAYINWKPLPNGYMWADGNGSNPTVNAYIRAGADAAKALGSKKLFLAMWHEPENEVNVDNCASPAAGASMGRPSDYTDLWHNVRAIFDQEGVTNVVWVMNYMGFSKWNCLVPSLWPGNNYVDWITYDPYGSGTSNYNSSVSNLYDYMLQNSNATQNYTSKPWGLAEMGYGSGGSSNYNEAGSEQYWKDASTAITNNTYPRLNMYLVFDTNANGAHSQVGMDIGGGVSLAKQKNYNDFANAIFAKGGVSPPPQDTQAPSVSLASPSAGSTISKTITVSANASDNVGVSDVKLYVDSTQLKDDTNGADGWNYQWDTTGIGNGSHTVKAVAYDAAGNSASATAVVVVSNAGAPAINSFTANPGSVASGGKSTLSWSTSNAPSCSVSPGGPNGTSSTTWQTGALSSTTTFTLSCSTASKTVQVTVVPAPGIGTFSANPATLVLGNSTTLSWAASNTSGCSVTPDGPSNTKSTSWQTLGLTTVGTTTYTLTCQNSVGQTVSKTAAVTVQQSVLPPGNVQLSASNTSIVTGGTVTLSWSSTNASSCVLNPGNFTATGSISSKTITNLQDTTTYSVTCSNTAGSKTSNSVTVQVSATPVAAAPVISSFTAQPSSLASGATSTLSWAASNIVAGGCNLMPSPLSSTSASNQWTTPALIASAAYTLTCKNSAGVTASKSVSVTVANQPAPAAPKPVAPTQIEPTTSATSTTVRATNGQTVINMQAATSAKQGSLITLDPTTITNPEQIVKVEFYNSEELIETASEQPFALNTSPLKPGAYTITQRIYFTDGSSSQKSQIITIQAKNTSSAIHVSFVWPAVFAGVGIGVVGFVVRLLIIRRAKADRGRSGQVARLIHAQVKDFDLRDLPRR